MNNHRITLNQLIRIAEDTPWEAFEAMSDGRLLLQDRFQTLLKDEEQISPLLWVFEMRIGLHFERPMQAIMSCGHFIRMRSTEQWQKHTLAKLDPGNPNGCLYSTNGFDSRTMWQPALAKPELVWLTSYQSPRWAGNNTLTPAALNIKI